ncbi:MAG: NAD(P)H-hydrate epimerase, partial [Caldimonas sp.]
MNRILTTTGAVALFGRAGTRAIETRATGALPEHTLMQRAGNAVARLALALAPHARRIRIAAGPGNNGGDGLEAAIVLRAHGKDASVELVGDPTRLPADAKAALARAREAGVAIDSPADGLDRLDLAIDALLGIGGSRAPEGALAAAVRRLNALACPVLAIDVPSGLDVDTGQPFGADCVVAQHTLALLTLKPGLFTAAGRDHAGSVWLDRLEVDTGADQAPDAWLIGSAITPRGARRHATHKGSFGDVAVVGGVEGMSGAALLAARAAHAAGAGRVYAVLLHDARGAAFDCDPVRPEVMFRSDWCENSSPALLAQTTVVCG